MLNTNTIIIGDNNGTLREYIIEGDNLKLFSKKGKADNDTIYTILNLSNNQFATGFGDNTIKIW